MMFELHVASLLSVLRCPSTCLDDASTMQVIAHYPGPAVGAVIVSSEYFYIADPTQCLYPARA